MTAMREPIPLARTERAADVFGRLQKSIDFIEANLREDLAIGDIASSACYSVFHFQRLFTAGAGIPVMEYVRKRRLASAALELCRTGRRVIDLALEFRFGFEQSFIRSFKNEFGITPARFARNGHGVPVFGRMSLPNGVCLLNGPARPRLIVRHGQRLVGTREYFLFAENGEDSICFRMKSRFVRKHRDSFDGRSVPLYSLVESVPGDPDGGFFALGVPRGAVRSVPGEFDPIDVPPHLCLSLVEAKPKHLHRLVMADLNPGFDRVYSELGRSAYRPVDGVVRSYTALDLCSLQNDLTEYSINLPVSECDGPGAGLT